MWRQNDLCGGRGPPSPLLVLQSCRPFGKVVSGKESNTTAKENSTRRMHPRRPPVDRGGMEESHSGNFASPAGCSKQSCSEIHPEAATETKGPTTVAKTGATIAAARKQEEDPAKPSVWVGGGRPTTIGFIYWGTGNASTSFLIAEKGGMKGRKKMSNIWKRRR